LLEGRGADFMMRLVGMMPKEVASFPVFCARLIDAIQMTNDERVHTKENHTRTCVLNTEYVGTVDFKLEAADYEFLWRKGYLYTYYWLENKNEKAKDKAKAKRKKVGAAMAKEMLKAASAIKEEDLPKAEPKAEPGKAPGGAASVPQDGGEILRMRLQGVLSNTVMTDADKMLVLQKIAQSPASTTTPSKAFRAPTTRAPGGQLRDVLRLGALSTSATANARPDSAPTDSLGTSLAESAAAQGEEEEPIGGGEPGLRTILQNIFSPREEGGTQGS